MTTTIYIGVVFFKSVLQGILAQLGEHLPYKQRVIGSSPIGPTKCIANKDARA